MKYSTNTLKYYLLKRIFLGTKHFLNLSPTPTLHQPPTRFRASYVVPLFLPVNPIVWWRIQTRSPLNHCSLNKYKKGTWVRHVLCVEGTMMRLNPWVWGRNLDDFQSTEVGISDARHGALILAWRPDFIIDLQGNPKWGWGFLISHREFFKHAQGGWNRMGGMEKKSVTLAPFFFRLWKQV